MAAMPGPSHEQCSGQPLQRPSDDQNRTDRLPGPQHASNKSLSNGGTDAVDADHKFDEAGEADDEDTDSDWTNESLMEQHIGLIDDEDYPESETESCSLAESKHLRNQLREVGAEEFVRRTLEVGTYTVRKLCTAFGVVLPDMEFINEAGDETFLPLLGALMKRELAKRRRLKQYTTVDDATKLLRECSNIIVLTGAGISTNLGIPDFRSKGTGLYSRLEHLGLSDPQEVFDITLFTEDPTIFYSVAKDIVPASKRYSPTHAFIRLLQDKGKLLTNFTQNIDNLEEAAGILPEKLIQCHGSFATATCRKCGFQCSGDLIAEDLKAGRVARCTACIRRIRQLQPLGLKRKHSTGSLGSKKKRRKDFEGSSDSDEADDDLEEPGVMKPDITFFGEGLPKTFHDRLLQHDRERTDLVIVIGTSLKVAPVADIPDFLPPTVPQIYISRDPVNHIEFDVELLGDCDQIVTELCRRAGWDLQHEMIPPEQVLVEKPYSETFPTRWTLTPKEGSASTLHKELDSGTLGHGSALSPPQQRFGPRKEPAVGGGKVTEGRLPDVNVPEANAPESSAPETMTSGALLAEQAMAAVRASSASKRLAARSVPPTGATDAADTENGAQQDDDKIGESITLTPRSSMTPSPAPAQPDKNEGFPFAAD